MYGHVRDGNKGNTMHSFTTFCYDCAWLSLTALSTVTRDLWL
jgi:hypothetical protein